MHNLGKEPYEIGPFFAWFVSMVEITTEMIFFFNG